MFLELDIVRGVVVFSFVLRKGWQTNQKPKNKGKDFIHKIGSVDSKYQKKIRAVDPDFQKTKSSKNGFVRISFFERIAEKSC